MFNEEESKTKIDPIDHHVGKRLKMRRMMLGLSQQDLGDAVNVSIQQIQKYEKATNRISSGKLYVFAQLLKVPINYFFDKICSTSGQSSQSEHLTQYDDTELNFSFAEDQERFLFTEHIPEKEVVTLVQAFNEIQSPQVRKGVVDFVKTLVGKK